MSVRGNARCVESSSAGRAGAYTQRSVTRLIPLLLVFLSACDLCAPKTVLVAVVEDEGALVFQRQERGRDWQVVRRLPPQARGVQVSPNGTHLAWIEDVTTGQRPLMQAWAWPASASAPSLIGQLGLARVDAPGLAVSDKGDVAWVDVEGRLRLWPDDEVVGQGFSPVFGSDGLGWVDGVTKCVRGGATRGGICAPVAQVFDVRGAWLLAGVVGEVARVESTETLRMPASEPLLGSLSPKGRVAVVHRDRTDGVLADALSVWTGSELKSLVKRAIIVSVDWESDTTLLLVGNTERRDIYELMLAHAAAEFGGQSTAGTAVRIGLDGQERRIAGLPEGAVRLLWRVR